VTSGGGWLVTPTNWDPGWRARVNGHAVTPVRANFAHLGVPIPAGRATVVLSYRPPGLRLGTAVSVVAAVVAVALLVPWRRSHASAESQHLRRTV
jgi:uncharacterized membrane protein YfhO